MICWSGCSRNDATSVHVAVEQLCVAGLCDPVLLSYLSLRRSTFSVWKELDNQLGEGFLSVQSSGEIADSTLNVARQ